MNKKINSFFNLNKPVFIISAAKTEQFPKTKLKEFAFIGRSNVGKSSIINAITNSKIAKTSKTPGRTREINFFNLLNNGNDKCTFVDMPGYGFAMATENEKYNWRKLISNYLSDRTNLVRLFLLIDSRCGLKQNDLEFIDFLDTLSVNYQIILTKIDTINKEEYKKTLEKINIEAINHLNLNKEILFASSSKNYGIEDIRTIIYDLIK